MASSMPRKLMIPFDFASTAALSQLSTPDDAFSTSSFIVRTLVKKVSGKLASAKCRSTEERSSSIEMSGKLMRRSKRAPDLSRLLSSFEIL